MNSLWRILVVMAFSLISGVLFSPVSSWAGNNLKAHQGIFVGQPYQVAFIVQPRNVISGKSISPAIQIAVEDSRGDIIKYSTAQINLKSSRGNLLGITSVRAVNGIATFSTLSAGSGYSLTATSTGLKSANSDLFNVTASSPVSLGMTSKAQVLTSGQCSALTSFQVYDQYGNPAQFPIQTVLDLSSTKVGAILNFYSDNKCTKNISSVAVPKGAGSGSFYFMSDPSGSAILTVSGVGSPFLNPANQNETINFGQASNLVFTVQPSNAVAGNLISPPVQIAIEDQYGNLVTNSNAQISLTLYNTSTQLQGGTTMNAKNGIASFPSIFVTAATQGLRIMAVSAGLTGCLSNSFSVAPNVPTSLSIISQSQAVNAESCSSAVVFQAFDAYGNQAMFSQGTQLNLSNSGADILNFYSDPQCSQAITNINMAEGTGSGTFYFSGLIMGSGTLNISGAGLTPAQQVEGINIGPKFFGLNLMDSQNFPDQNIKPYGSVRLWDSHVTWNDIEPSQGVYDFSQLDVFIQDAQTYGVDVIYTVGETPQWASSNPLQDCGKRPSGSCVSPTHWSDFSDFLTVVANRYKSIGIQTDCTASDPQCHGVIKYYELWNEPRDPGEWYAGQHSDCTQEGFCMNYFVKMTQVAIAAIGEADLTAHVTSPGNSSGYAAIFMGAYWNEEKNENIQPLTRFDSINYHAYSAWYYPIPENQPPYLAALNATMSQYGITSQIKNSEGTWSDPPHNAPAADQTFYIARHILVNLAMGAQSFVWYRWDNDAPLWDPSTKSLTSLGQTYQIVAGWLLNSSLGSAGCWNSLGIWKDILSCDGVNTSMTWAVNLAQSNGQPAQAIWYVSTSKSDCDSTGENCVDWNASANYSVPSQYLSYLDIGGVRHAVPKGNILTVTASPVLLQTVAP